VGRAPSSGVGGRVVSFTIVAGDQRSAEWHLARVGRLTGSRAADMMATIKSGEAAARRDLRAQLVVEKLTGQPQEDAYVNAVMQRGIDLEPKARRWYEALTGQMVRQTGFLSHDALAVGCSLDGDVGNFAGIVELKCPKSATHLKYLRAGGKLPTEHLYQVVHNLWISGAGYCDFCSFDDRFPVNAQFVRMRVERDEAQIKAYELAASLFLSEVDRDVEAVRALVAAA